MQTASRRAAITAVRGHLPDEILDNEPLAECSEHWSAEKIAAKLGIRTRRIAAPEQCASDLAQAAAEKLLSGRDGLRSSIDYVLFCTQFPDYPLPTTACLLQDRLGLPTTCGALDINLGCSGYVYALGLAQGLIETDQADRVLLLTGETYSKALEESDVGVRTIFGDAGAATLVEAIPADVPQLGPFVYGTDGRGGENLILRRHAWRTATTPVGCSADGRDLGGESEDPYLRMNGSEIFVFTIRTVPKAVHALLAKAGLTLGDVDRFVFHQANAYMLEHLRDKIGIPPEKFVVEMESVGNTVSNSIPLALEAAAASGQLKPGHRVMLVGFGVGYSWGATLVHWA